MLVIPSVVFVELFDIFFHDVEYANRIYYELFVPIYSSENIEIRPIDKDTLIALASLKQGLRSHDMHDKIILSTAIALNCKLITFDPLLINYVENNMVIPGVCK